jgi:hypothetical protein
MFVTSVIKLLTKNVCNNVFSNVLNVDGLKTKMLGNGMAPGLSLLRELLLKKEQLHVVLRECT